MLSYNRSVTESLFVATITGKSLPQNQTHPNTPFIIPFTRIIMEGEKYMYLYQNSSGKLEMNSFGKNAHTIYITTCKL